MIHKLEDKYTLEFVNNKITNVDSIVEAIKEETNTEMLKEYYDFLKNKLNPLLYEGLDSILTTLDNKLNSYEQNNNILEKIQNTYVELEEAIPLISNYTNNFPLNEEQLIKIYSYLSNAITLYEYEYNESLSKREQDILHYAMEYMKTTNPNSIESALIERYDKCCQKEIESASKSNGMTKRLLNPNVPVSLSDDGITLTTIIITITILLGSVIAAIMLVK